MIFVGVDPSVRSSALAIWRDDEPATAIKTHLAGRVEDIGSNPVLQELAKGLPEVYVLIECPTWSGPGTKETRVAALAWERVIQQLFFNRRVCRVDPREWQAVVLKNVPGDDTKTRSLWYCQNALQIDVRGSHDKADAACVVYYARSVHWPGKAARIHNRQTKKAVRRRVS